MTEEQPSLKLLWQKVEYKVKEFQKNKDFYGEKC